MEINNSIVLITGGTSGIGLATGNLLDKKGAIVAGVARDDNSNAHFSVLAYDLTKPDAAEEVVDRVLAHWGHIDILINCAASGMFGSIEETKLSDYQYVINLNLLAPFLLMKAVIPSMKERKKGMIVNVSAAPANEAIAGMGPYLSTKCGLDSLTRVARRELRTSGIKVASLMPKHTDTGFGSRAIGQLPAWAGKMKGDTAEDVAKALVEELIEKEAPELFL